VAIWRPFQRARDAWMDAIEAEWDVPPPLMQGTIKLYDDSHGYQVGHTVEIDEHRYEVIAVNGAEIEVREVPRG